MERHRFNAQWLNHPEIQQFQCGLEEWSQYVADWIRAPVSAQFDSALFCVENGTSVWIYRHPTDQQLIGYGSLGVSKRDKKPVQIIPAFAVATAFQGQPPNTEFRDRFASRIFRDLLREAFMRTTLAEPCSTVITLYVHPNNLKARAFYERHNFQAAPKVTKNGVIMARALTATDGETPPIPGE